MPLISLYNISEQCVARLGSTKAEYQALIAAIKSAYGYLTIKEWYLAKQEGVSEITGGAFYEITGISPQLDGVKNQYFIDIPSTYISLPHNMGVNFVGYPNSPFVLMGTGLSNLFSGLLADALGNNLRAEIVGDKIYFPKMEKNQVGDIMLRLAVAFSEDPDENLNISPNMVNDIINLVVAQFMPTPKAMPDTLIK